MYSLSILTVSLEILMHVKIENVFMCSVCSWNLLWPVWNVTGHLILRPKGRRSRLHFLSHEIQRNRWSCGNCSLL